MIYAPVIIPTLCRADKLKRCITSLQNNEYAIYTELYISLDYPLLEKHWDGYKQIKEYLHAGIDGFAKVIILEQTSNQGWYGNYKLLREKVYENHSCYIFTEDDNEFSKDYLEYMDKCLTKYEQDMDVVAVSGYSYPIDWKAGGNNVLFIESYFSAWGYGTWRSKEEIMLQQINIKQFENYLYDNKKMIKLYHISKNQYCNFIKGMVEYTNMLLEGEEVLTVDLAYAMYQIFENKYMIFPTLSKVRNTGYGGEGVHCSKIDNKKENSYSHRQYDYSRQPIDESASWGEVIAGTKHQRNQWNNLMERFFIVSRRELWGSIVMQMCCGLFGRKYVARLCRRFKKV